MPRLLNQEEYFKLRELNLRKYLVKGSKVLMSFEQGKHIRLLEDLINFKGKTRMIIDKDIYLVSLNFIIGLFFPLLETRNFQAIRENFEIVDKRGLNIRGRVEEAIRLYSNK